MHTRKLHRGWTALAVGVLMLSGAGLAKAGECAGTGNSGCNNGGNNGGYQSGWQRFCNRWNNNGYPCHSGNHCHGGWGHGGLGNGCWGHGGWCNHCGCWHGCNGCSACGCLGGPCIVAVNPGYSDPRDGQLYSAQGFNVPVAVPLAPVVKQQYNYGWGVPSSRITRVGAQYSKWHPDTLYSQTGGQLVGGQYQTIYQPTDTTQQGFYYVHVPRWGRYGSMYGAW